MQAQKTFSSKNLKGNKKSVLIAYVLTVLLGVVGVHRFYVDRSESGFWMMIVFSLGVLSPTLMGMLMVGVVSIWTLVDLFFIPRLVREYNASMTDIAAVEQQGS